MTTTGFLYAAAVLATLAAFRADPGKARKGLRTAWRSLSALAPTLLAMTGLIGIMLAVTPPGTIAALFRHHGAAGFLLISLVGAFMTMPAPIAFPLAGSLHHMGATYGALAAFITTLTMVGFVTAPMEVACFGRRFTAVRQGLSLGAALLIGLLMGVILR